MGINFINRKNRDDSAGSGADLAAFENNIVDLDKTGVMPELNEGFWDEPSSKVDEEFDAKYADDEEEYYTEEFATSELEAICEYTEEFAEEQPAEEDISDEEEYSEGDYDDFSDEVYEESEESVTGEFPQTEEEFYTEEFATSELGEVGDYTEEIPVEDDGYVNYDETAPIVLEEPAAREYEDSSEQDDYDSYDEPAVSPAEDEYVDLDRNVSEAPVRENKKINLPSKGMIFKISVIAAACIMLAVLGVFAFVNRKPAGAAQSSGTYVNGIYVNETMQGAGNEISEIDMIGERGLVAALDARVAAMAAAETPAPGEITVDNDYGETAFTTSTSVGIELVTVKSDLKIKFLNSGTGKLIPNVPFKVTVTDPSGKKSEWTDDDLDGIIYKTSLAEGKYTVHVDALDGDKYAGYSWPSDKTANVRNTIAYSSVNVKDEVKNANQVNEAVEDTASRGGTSQLSTNDTVAFVESTTSTEYKEIGKDSITVVTGTMVGGTENGDNNQNTENNQNSENNQNTENTENNQNNENKEEKEPEKPAEKPTVKLSLSQSSLKVTAGQTATFTASVEVTVAPGTEIKASSSDASIASVSVSDKTITVKGEKAGSCEITVTATTTTNDTVKDTATASAKCSITVEAAVAGTAPLKDKSGNDVYVLEDGKYRKATYADLSKFDKFYIVSGTKYTGWQTIGGATYYYDKDGKAVTGTQVIQGVTYQFGSDGKMVSTSGVLGIDVSKWQGNIDWNAVKAAGVQYVIIRVGYRGSTAGALIDDSKFASNIQGAKAAGLGVGVYFVTQAVNDVEAVYEASMVLDRIKGYSLEYPVFLDVEPSNGRGDKIDKATRTAVCIAFCETIRNAGYTPGIYANKTWFETKMNTSQLSSYKIWVAHYSSVCGYTGRYDYWQYTDKGRIAGVSGNVDLDLKYT